MQTVHILRCDSLHLEGNYVIGVHGQTGGPETEGGYLQPGEWNFGIGYRVDPKAQVLGDGHRDTLTSLDDLASVLAESGQLAEAAEIYERVVAGRTSLLGPAHARTAASAEALAKVRRDLGGEPDPGSGADRQDPSEQALDSGRPVVAGGRPDEARDPVTAAGTMEPEAGNPSRPAPADHTSAGGRPAARSSATGSSAAGQAVATRVIRLVRHLAARYSALP